MHRTIREGLSAVGQSLHIEATPAQVDRAAAALRDAFFARDVDAGDIRVLEGAFFASWMALCQVMSVPSFGPSALGGLWMQTEVIRRWIDGEMKVMSPAEMLHVPGI